jgi:hypothetical protein
VVEVEGLAIHRQAPALARSAPLLTALIAIRLLSIGAVPRVGIAHIGTRTEDTAFTPQDDDLYIVVPRKLVEIFRHLLPHLRVIRIATLGIVDGDAGDPRMLVMLEHHSRVRQCDPPHLG